MRRAHRFGRGIFMNILFAMKMIITELQNISGVIRKNGNQIGIIQNRRDVSQYVPIHCQKIKYMIKY